MRSKSSRPSRIAAIVVDRFVTTAGRILSSEKHCRWRRKRVRLWRVRRYRRCGYAMDSGPHHPGRWLLWLPCDNRAICRADRRNCSYDLRSASVSQGKSFVPFPSRGGACSAKHHRIGRAYAQSNIGLIDLPMPQKTHNGCSACCNSLGRRLAPLGRHKALAVWPRLVRQNGALARRP